MLLSAYVFFIPGRPYNAIEAALYGSLHHIGFALSGALFFVLVTWGQIGRLHNPTYVTYSGIE
jgi:hypothetical protein